MAEVESDLLPAGSDNVDALDLLEDEFATPPDSPDDVKITLSDDIEEELKQIETAEEYIKKNQESIARSAESVRELQETMTRLINQTGVRKTELENRTYQLKEMKREIEEINMEAIAKEEEELQKLISVADNRESNQEEHHNANLTSLQQQINAYKEQLGIEVNIDTDNIEFKFTQIDKECPDSSYSIKLVVKDDQYKCLGCEPSVDSIDTLIDELNSHHDLQKFVVTLRGKFSKLVNKEN